MIDTVTLNPSLDYIVSVPDFKLGATNRAQKEQMAAGGKGINVSQVLTALGVENTALGFTAGFVGEEIRQRLREEDIRCDFLTLSQGCSRINVKLRNYEGTEINARGPEISESELEQLREKLRLLTPGDVVVLSGSIPAGMPKTLYAELMRNVIPEGVKVVVDAAGEALRSTLPLRPFLIKPNLDELEELIRPDRDFAQSRETARRQQKDPEPVQGRHQKILNPEEPQAEDVLRLLSARIQKMGAQNVLISLAGAGAALLDAEGGWHRRRAPEGTLVNGVGAGDSMVAGFLAGYERTGNYETAFRMGLAAGSASAFSEQLAGKEEIMELYRNMEREKE